MASVNDSKIEKVFKTGFALEKKNGKKNQNAQDDDWTRGPSFTSITSLTRRHANLHLYVTFKDLLKDSFSLYATNSLSLHQRQLSREPELN